MPLLGVPRSIAQLEAVRAALAPAIANSMQPVLQALHERARDVYCPIDKGPLRASAVLDGPRPDAPGVVAGIRYGATAAVDYAVVVHERTDLSHATPTCAKYLQRAVDERLPTLTSHLPGAIRSAFVVAIR